MPIDIYGYDNAVNQFNSIKQSNQELNSQIQDWNNKIMTEYNSAKNSEGVTDDANYVKDVLGNIQGASGLNSAYKNRQNTLINQAKKRLADIMPDPVEPPPAPEEPVDYGGNAPSLQLSGGTDQAGFGSSVSGELEPIPTSNIEPSVERTSNTSVSSGEPTQALRNGGSPEEVSTLEETIGDTKEDPTILGTAINKLSGGALGEETAEAIGKVGGAITNGTLGGIDLIEGIDNLGHNKSFYAPGTTGTEKFSKDAQMIAGVSDAVGLIPGLEWVAGIGNLVGVAGGVAGMFGDHSKNIQNDANVEAMKGNLKTPPSSAQPQQAPGVSQSTLRPN